MIKKSWLMALIFVGFSNVVFAQNVLENQIDSLSLQKLIERNFVWNTYVGTVSNHLREVHSQIQITTPEGLTKLEKKAKSVNKITNIIKIVGISGCGFGMYEAFKSIDADSNQKTDQAVREFVISDGITVAATLIGNRATNKAYDRVEVCETENAILKLSEMDNPLRELDEDKMNRFILDIVKVRMMENLDQGNYQKDRLNNLLYRLNNSTDEEHQKINRAIDVIVSSLTLDEFATILRINEKSESYRQAWKRVRRFKKGMSDETSNFYRSNLN